MVTLTFTTKTETVTLDFTGASTFTSSLVNGTTGLVESLGSRGVVVVSGCTTDGTPNQVQLHYVGHTSAVSQGLQSYHSTSGERSLFSQGEPTGLSRWLPCCDQPSIRHALKLTVVAPAAWLLAANGPVESHTSADATTVRTYRDALRAAGAGTGDSADSSFARWEFAETPAIPPHTIALTGGDMHREEIAPLRVAQSAREIPLSIYVRKSVLASGETCVDDLRDILECAKASAVYLGELFGMPMPFAKLDFFLMPEAASTSAMENVGLISLTESYLCAKGPAEAPMSAVQKRVSTIAHEVSHMWFGNLVGVQWWDGLWLKEAFASILGEDFAGSDVAEARYPGIKAATAAYLVAACSRACSADTAAATSSPVGGVTVASTDAAENAFSALTYSKGCAILGQLRQRVGVDKWRQGLQRIVKEFGWQTIKVDDFFTAMSVVEPTPGMLKEWLGEWMETRGPSVLTARYDDESRTVEVTQTASEPSGNVLRHHATVVAAFDDKMRETGRVTVLLPAAESYTLSADELADLRVGENGPAFLLANATNVTYCIEVLSDRSLQAAKASLASLEDATARCVAWRAIIDAVKAAQVSAASFVEMAVAQLPAEQSVSVLQFVSTYLTVIVTHYCPDARRSELANKVGLMALAQHEAVKDSKGSEAAALTEAWLQVAINAAKNDREVAKKVGRLLSSVTERKLRWSIIQSCVMFGIKGSDKVLAAEAEKDQSSTSEKMQRTIAAGRLQDKAATFTMIKGYVTKPDPSLRSDLVWAAMAGFWTHPHRVALEPYGLAWLDHLPVAQRDYTYLFYYFRHFVPTMLVESNNFFAKFKSVATTIAAGPTSKYSATLQHKMACELSTMERLRAARAVDEVVGAKLAASWRSADKANGSRRTNGDGVADGEEGVLRIPVSADGKFDPAYLLKVLGGKPPTKEEVAAMRRRTAEKEAARRDAARAAQESRSLIDDVKAGVTDSVSNAMLREERSRVLSGRAEALAARDAALKERVELAAARSRAVAARQLAMQARESSLRAREARVVQRRAAALALAKAQAEMTAAQAAAREAAAAEAAAKKAAIAKAEDEARAKAKLEALAKQRAEEERAARVEAERAKLEAERERRAAAEAAAKKKEADAAAARDAAKAAKVAKSASKTSKAKKATDANADADADADAKEQAGEAESKDATAAAGDADEATTAREEAGDFAKRHRLVPRRDIGEWLTEEAGATRVVLLPADGSAALLGRGEVTGISHLKLGRQQASIECAPGSDTVTVTRLGKNPSWLQRADGSAPVALAAEERVPVSQGDVLFLLKGKFPFELRTAAKDLPKT
eukprot:CAMPEP_0170744526 /NCGR_PEP_ID=MMETSP0437-20130122/7826_1 /TAXON_ID=0 /ORGANISM="Sexangularia sp." /LENGTH=1318 /DNA_ID=CAMNT_0011083223 /DNA_START=114 /DNA_END=4066 /DNA_ORIENTATION=-